MTKITSNKSDMTLDFAQEEILRWTSAVSGESLAFELIVEPSMKPFSFSVACADGEVRLSGPTSTEVLHAVYTAFEMMGCRFEITGPVLPEKLDITKLPKEPVVIEPKVERRGIRQHINFPMDISSYPLEEALEYIRNLARLRYNYMTFHSYPGHWTWERYENMAVFDVYRRWTRERFAPSNDDLCNGAFFYGDHFPIPDYPLVKDNIRFNKEIFCAPEVEDVYFTIKERSEVMTRWLASVMRECKRVGMTVQLSTEIRMADEQYNIGLLDRILKDYPMIDVIELITRENGDSMSGDEEEFKRRQIGYFEEILSGNGKELDEKYYYDKPEVAYAVKDLALAIRLARYAINLGWARKNNIKFAVGSYVVDQPMVKFCSELAEKYMPDGVLYTVMPAHSSRLVADHFEGIGMSEKLCSNTVAYTWIEFDGYMYLQQLSAFGIYSLVQTMTRICGGPAYAVLANHWRTAENFMSFRYLSEVSLTGISPDDFLLEYAEYAGIKDTQAFLDAMREIDKLSDIRAIAGNIGFPIKGTWIAAEHDRSIGSVWWWGKDAVERAIDGFKRVYEQLKRAVAEMSNREAAKVLDIMANQSEAAYCHLKGVRLMQDCAVRFNWETCSMPDDLTDDEKAMIVERCDEAEKWFYRYLELLASHRVDRGVEGVIINYYYGPLVMTNNVKAVYANVGQYIEVDTDKSTVPMPLTTSERQAGAKVFE